MAAEETTHHHGSRIPDTPQVLWKECEVETEVPLSGLRNGNVHSRVCNMATSHNSRARWAANRLHIVLVEDSTLQLGEASRVNLMPRGWFQSGHQVYLGRQGRRWQA